MFENIMSSVHAFADPATDPIIKRVGDVALVEMMRDGSDISFSVSLTNGRVTTRRGLPSREYSTFGSLLASHEFADLRRVSETQRRIFADFNENEFISISGKMTFEDNRSVPLDIDLLDQLLCEKRGGSEKTRVVLLDGSAGVGKTSLINRLIVRRARSASAPPLLHVESRGAKLYSLSQLLAASLDALRSKITYDQIPCLVRNGLINVAIDGFDELVDSEGYTDAWIALSDFLADIGASGNLILSGRDTFFDQQAFNQRLADKRQQVELIGATISPISSGEAVEYLKARGWPCEEVGHAQDAGLFVRGSYALRPFFLRAIADARVKTWDELTAKSTVRNFLIDAFLLREADKIVPRTKLSLSRAKELLTELFSEIAVEMAASETDRIDIQFVEMLLDIIFRPEVGDEKIGLLAYKAGSIGLLEAAGERDYRRFPHTEISHFFLAKGISGADWSAGMKRLLTRATLGVDFLAVFAEEFIQSDEALSCKFVEFLQQALSEDRSLGGQLDSNLAALWMATLGRPVECRLSSIRNYSISEAALSGALAGTTLENLIINRLDVRHADLKNVNFTDCAVATLIADEHTHFGRSVPAIEHVQIVGAGSVENLRGADLGEWISGHQVISESSWANDSEEFLWRLLHYFAVRYGIRNRENDPGSRFFRNKLWTPVEAVLDEFGRVERSPNRGGGPKDDFIRIRDPQGLLNYDDDESKKIWDAVKKIR